jgi:hypothetical protein
MAAVLTTLLLRNVGLSSEAVRASALPIHERPFISSFISGSLSVDSLVQITIPCSARSGIHH